MEIPASRFSPAREGGIQGLSFFLCFLVLCFALRCVVFCCVVPFFRVFLGKCGKGRFPVSQNFHPAQCPNPNPCVPKPKPIPMHSPQSDGYRAPAHLNPRASILLFNPDLHLAKENAGVSMPKRVIVVAQMKCATVAIASMAFPNFFNVRHTSRASNTLLGLNSSLPGCANRYHQFCGSPLP